MKVIVDHKRSKVLYDTEEKVYIKKFYPKAQNRLKYFFRFRKYPGYNYDYISSELNRIGIRTPKIVSISKYIVKTKEVEGIILEDYLKKNKDEKLEREFEGIVVKILKEGIYFGDFNTGNFIVGVDGHLYALDLEDYRKEKLLFRKEGEVLKRLEKTLPKKEWVENIKRKLKKEEAL